MVGNIPNPSRPRGAIAAPSASTLAQEAAAHTGHPLSLALLTLTFTRRIAVPDLTTTVLTMTLTALAADSRLVGGSGKGTTRRTSAVITMLAGAVAGALILKTSLTLPLACAAALAFVNSAAYVLLPIARARFE
jgi:Protein of unknown function (DUF1275)